MEMIIIGIIAVVFLISICICVCILGQTIRAKRRQPNIMHPHFNTDTLPNQAPQYGDGGHIMTSSWMCAYQGEKPASPHIWETPLPVPCADQSEGDYTLPANMRHGQDKADQHAPLLTEPALSENIQPASQMLTSCTPAVSDGDYTAPIAMNADDQQHAAAAPPQPMPEYTLPIKKQKQESSPAHSAEVSASDDYLLPSTMRPEPIGENVAAPVVFEGSSLKNAGYRPESVMLDSVKENDNEK